MTRLRQTPLAYADQHTAGRQFKFDRRPTTSDYANFEIGDEWLAENVTEWWKMADKTGSSGVWIMMGAATSAALDFLPDTGTSPVIANASNEITIAGGTGVATVGSLNTITFNAAVSVATSYATDAGTATPAANILNVVGGASVSTSGAGDTITITSAGTTIFTWVEVVGTSQAMAVNTGYIANNLAQVVLTLPAVATVGDTVRISGKGGGGWSLAQNAGQTVNFLGSSTTPGVGGSLTPIEDRGTINIICETANTVWNVLSSNGNYTVV